MQSLSGQLLAGAALSEQQYWPIDCSESGQLFQCGGQRGGVADDAFL